MKKREITIILVLLFYILLINITIVSVITNTNMFKEVTNSVKEFMVKDNIIYSEPIIKTFIANGVIQTEKEF